MVTIRNLRHLAALLVCVGAANIAAAAPITTLFNTGVATNDANGNPLTVTADGSPDAHWMIVQEPSGNQPNTLATPFSAVVTDQNGVNGPYPFTVWEADSSTSKWISPHADESNITEPNGDGSSSLYYEYQTTFTLSGFNPATQAASISGKFWEDDFVRDIILNSNDTGISQLGNNSSGAGFPFSITSGFVNGVNTLTFVAENYPTGINPNPTGVDIQLTGSVVALPEPASLTLLSLGAVLGMRRRNRRAAK